MRNNINIKKLLTVALYSSPLIGMLSITPMFIIRELPVVLYPKAVAIITIIVFAGCCLNILLRYVSASIGLNKIFKYFYYLPAYILNVPLIALALNFLKFSMFYPDNFSGFAGPRSPFASYGMAFIINTLIIIIQDLILLREKKAKIETENANLKLINAEAINQQLRQQIHPHFLFNSLNTLKSLINKSPEAAEDYLIKLSDFLRKTITVGNEYKVIICDEVKLCKDYLEMQKIRYGSSLQFNIDIPDDVCQNAFLPVFSLQLLAENAIKHNAMTVESPLKINIQYSKGSIIVSNNLQAKYTSETSTGIGLNNLAERYKILSGDELIIKSTDNTFTVSIKILNNENSNNRR